MAKRILTSVVLMALLTSVVSAGDLKYEDWPTEYLWHEIGEAIPVYLDIPFYVILHPQNLRIDLEQVGSSGPSTAESFHFQGVALDTTNQQKPSVSANFNCELSVSLTVTPSGELIQPDINKWSASIAPDMVAAGTSEVVTIQVDVYEVDLLGYVHTTSSQVAEVDVLVRPTSV